MKNHVVLRFYFRALKAFQTGREVCRKFASRIGDITHLGEGDSTWQLDGDDSLALDGLELKMLNLNGFPTRAGPLFDDQLGVRGGNHDDPAIVASRDGLNFRWQDLGTERSGSGRLEGNPQIQNEEKKNEKPVFHGGGWLVEGGVTTGRRMIVLLDMFM